MKKSLKLFLAGGAFTMAAIITFGMSENVSFGAFANSSEKWVHYERREATSSQYGIREYWVKCGGGYQFTEPNTGIITDATYYDTSLFSSNDPRYIKYLSDDVVVYYDLSTSSFNYNDASQLTGYTSTSYSTTAGTTSRIDFIKNDYTCAYSAKCLTATGTISSNDDLESIQDTLETGNVDGYYVLTADLSSPSNWVTAKPTDTNGCFSGTFDGRGHKIDNPSFWGYRMLGRIKNATVKDIDFTNISIFSVLAWEIYDTTIQNVTFTCVDECNSYSNVGLICDSIYGTTTFKNVTVDYKQNYLEGMTPIASWNACPINENMFQNVTVRCLASQNMFNVDSCNRSLRPSEINYISTRFLVEKSVSNYKIYYPTGDTACQYAAELIRDEIKSATNKALTLSAISSDTVLDTTAENIIVGVTGTVKSAITTLPTNKSSYIIKTINNSYILYNEDSTSINVAAIKFLNIIMGYDYVGLDTTINNLNGSSTIDYYIIDVQDTPSFKYRKCDWTDSIWVNGYVSTAAGYNAGHGEFQRYINAPGVDDDSATDYFKTAQAFHTSLHLVYPGTYYDDHPKWFAYKNIFNQNYGDNYMDWQLCYTCRGDTDEYNALVSTVANKIISIASAQTEYYNMMFFGVCDNENVCKCSTCQKKANSSNYNSNSGAVIAFLNDVEKQVNASLTNPIDLVMLAYQQYEDAPIKDGSATITANEHVKICLAPIHADYTKSYDHEDNAEYKQAFQNWKLIGGLHCWLYETNFYNYLYPYNSFKATTETYKILYENGVEFVYSQGQHNVYYNRTGFNQLKKYLDSHFMMDVNSDYDTLVNNYFNSYYGGSGSRMRTFFDEACAQLDYIESNSDWEDDLAKYTWNTASIYHNVDNAEFWSFDQLTRWNNLCTTSYNAESSATVKKHILTESIFPRFALVTLFADQYDSTTLNNMRQAFVNDCATLQITMYSEGGYLQTDYFDDWGM